jgi:hypothetical protein
MTDTVPPRWLIAPRLVAVLGLVGMLVLIVLGFGALGVESGDRALYLSYIQLAVGAVTTAAAIVWLVNSRRKAGAVIVLVASVILSPIWLFLVIRILD